MIKYSLVFYHNNLQILTIIFYHLEYIHDILFYDLRWLMNEQKIINLIGEIGRLLLKHGAEIYRVEESLLRMCKSYGYPNVEVFALPTYFTLTIEMHDNHTYTLSKRTQQNRVNLDMVYELNNLVRYVCTMCPDYDYLKKRINKIKNTPINMPLVFVGYGLGTGFFTTFFGGGINETIVAMIIGFILYFFIWLMEFLEINNLVSTLLSSILLTSLAIFSFKLNIINSLQSTIIGCLMILTPGVAITNSLRDIMSGDYISGMARMLEALLTATFIAVGVGIMMVILGG